MSHTTTIKSVAIRDTAAMEAAAQELAASGVKCRMVRDQKPRMYYSNQHGACAYVLKLDDCPYDIGFDRQSDGTYAPVFDEWAGHVKGQIGAACPIPNSPEGRAQHAIGRFMQSYAKHAAINSAVMSGYTVESTSIDEQGNIQLSIAV